MMRRRDALLLVDTYIYTYNDFPIIYFRSRAHGEMESRITGVSDGYDMK